MKERGVVAVVSWALIGSVACWGSARAQTPAPRQTEASTARYFDPVGGLEIDRAVAVALEREPSLRAARTEVGVAMGMRTQAGLRPNPMVSFSQQNEPGGSDNQTRVEFVWPLDLSRKTGRVDLAERELEAARHVVADRERLLAADVRTKYGDVAADVRALSVLEDLVGAMSSQLALVSARVEQGATPPLERDMLRVERQRLESERLLLMGRVERTLVELKQVLGMEADAPLRIRQSLEDLVQRDAATPADAMVERPDVAASASRVKVAEAQIERARREGGVDMNLFGMYMRMDAGFPQQAFGAGGGIEPIRGLFHYVAVGAAITLPLRDRKQGEIAAAEAKRAGAAAELEAARLGAKADLASARVRVERARQAVSIYTSDTRALARQNLTVVGQTYELGRATVFDVLAEQRRYLDVERAYIETLREAYEARQALGRALGEVR
jgi:outer membrane protein, heavy metal efflux system